MKTLYLLLFTLAAITCAAQRTCVVTCARLAFVHPAEGIIVKQGETYSRFTVRVNFANDTVKYSPEFEPLTTPQWEALQKDPANIYPKDIKSLNPKKLHKTAFVHKGKYENETLRYVNSDYYALIEEEEGKEFMRHTSGYFYVQFGGKTLVVLEGDIDGLIVNTKKGLSFLKDGGQETYTAIENNYRFTEQDILGFDMQEDYIPDTLNGRVSLRNVFREVVIPHRYDSIAQSHYFIACYKGKNIDLYNHMLQKLDLPGLRVFIPTTYYIHEANILQGNTPKRIMVTGEELKKGRGYILDEMPSSDEPNLASVLKEEDRFYIESTAVQDLTGNYKQLLSHTEDIDSLYLPFYTVSSYIDHPVNVVCCKLKNGKYSIRSLQSVLYDTVDEYPYKGPSIENADTISVSGDFIFFEIRGLTGIWPLSTQTRYTRLDAFTNGFARFTLPNGQKGWLSITGQEYLDE